MAERRTTVVVEAKARGFEKTQREVKKTFGQLDTRELTKGFKQLTFLVREMGRQVSGLTSGMKEANRAFRMRDSVQGTQRLGEEIDRLRAKVESLTQAKKRDDEVDRRRANRQGFAMGVLQGAGVGEYFPAQGFTANVAGRVLGGGVRRAAAFGAVPFTGTQGLIQGLSGIPIVGGFLAGQAQNAMGAASEALGVRQQMMGIRALSTAPAPDYAAIRRRAERRAPQLGEGEVRRRAREAYVSGLPDLSTRPGILASLFGDAPDPEVERARLAAVSVSQAREDVASINRARKRAAGTRAVSRAARGPFQEALTAGVRFGGMGPQQSIQFAQSLLQMAGGSIQALGRGRITQAIAAQTRLGIGADVSGAFVRGQREGMGGVRAGGPDAFMAALRGGMSLALEGSDLTAYMRQMASQIMQWDSTGMPLNVRSAVAMSQALVGALGGVRAARVAGGIRTAGQRISKTGPTSAEQFLMLRDLYGLQAGASGEEFASALMRAEAGDFSPEGLQKFTARARIPGKENMSALVLRDMFARGGVDMTISEAKKILAGGGGTPAGSIQAAQKRAEGFDLQKEAARILDPQLRAKAGRELGRFGAGERLLPTLSNMEKASNNMLKNFSRFSKEMNAVTSVFRDMSDEVTVLVGRFRRVLDDVEAKLGLLPGG